MQDLIEFIATNPRNKWNRSVRKHTNWMQWLSNRFMHIPTLNEKLWLLSRNMDQRPTCAADGCINEVKWINDDHYGETCCYSCAQLLRKQNGKLHEIQAKMRATTLERYGVESATANAEVQDRRLATMISRYGAKVSSRTVESARGRAADLNKKARVTMKERYGVANPQQIPEVRAKTVDSFRSRYGTNNPSAIEEVKARKNQARQARWDALFSNVTILSESVPCEMRDKVPFANIRVTFRCNRCCHEETLPSETLKYRHARFGNACTKCCNISASTSRDEGLIADLISSWGIQVVRNDRQIIAPRELDIYLPDRGLAVEYCGLYWHSENRGRPRDYHINKLKSCHDAGIRLITIFEDEWHHRPHIVTSRLRNLLGISTNRIMARTCEVRTVTKWEANAFCTDNHLQGSGRTTHAIGLFHDNALTSCMTFSKLNVAKGRKHKSDSWELSRFCSSLDNIVIGGASKLFAHFVKLHDPQQVISYADRRWNTGNVYGRLGFKYDGDTPVNYWYINLPEVKRLHRFGLRKADTDRKDLSEWDNRRLQGWDRIWDCGNTRWIWSRSN